MRGRFARPPALARAPRAGRAVPARDLSLARGWFRACPWGRSTRSMLALRSLFGYTPFGDYSGVPLTQTLPVATRDPHDATHETPAPDTKLLDRIRRTTPARAQLRGDRRTFRVQLPGHGARAPDQPRKQGLHQAFVQRKPRNPHPALGDGGAGARASTSRRGGRRFAHRVLRTRGV